MPANKAVGTNPVSRKKGFMAQKAWVRIVKRKEAAKLRVSKKARRFQAEKRRLFGIQKWLFRNAKIIGLSQGIVPSVDTKTLQHAAQVMEACKRAGKTISAKGAKRMESTLEKLWKFKENRIKGAEQVREEIDWLNDFLKRYQHWRWSPFLPATYKQTMQQVQEIKAQAQEIQNALKAQETEAKKLLDKLTRALGELRPSERPRP